jgi:hypothetical protein
MTVWAICQTCAHRHRIDFDPLRPTNAFADWQVKHAAHPGVIFAFPQRRLSWTVKDWLRSCWRWRKRQSGGLVADLRTPEPEIHDIPSAYAAFLPNADVKLAYGASTAVTITLASLGASIAWLAGRESTAIDNGASNKYLDYLLAGHYRGGSTTLQAGNIRTAVVGCRTDAPTWPDVFDGVDSAETVSAQGIYDAVCRIASDIRTDAVQRTWPFGPVSIESLFGKVPDQWVVFCSHTAHTTTTAWSATEGDHAVSVMGVYATVL